MHRTNEWYLERLRQSEPPYEPCCDMYSPDHLDYTKSVSTAKALQNTIETELGLKTRACFEYQDAPFHASISYDNTEILCEVRISNFGRFATVFYRSLQSEDQHGRLVELISTAGYEYIPAEVLNLPYNGNHEGFTNWRERYFEYF